MLIYGCIDKNIYKRSIKDQYIYYTISDLISSLNKDILEKDIKCYICNKSDTKFIIFQNNKLKQILFNNLNKTMVPYIILPLCRFHTFYYNLEKGENIIFQHQIHDELWNIILENEKNKNR